MRRVDQELFNAVEQGNLSEVKKCLNRGADVLARNSRRTVLHSAVCGDNGEVIKLVLNKIKETQSPYIDAKDTEGDTPLMWTAESSYVNAAQVLLEYGANVEAKNNNGMTALHWAAKKGQREVAKLLIDNGANINAVDNDGMTALHWTAKEGQREVAKLLIDNGAATNAVDNNGRTALRWAEIKVNPGVGELLGGESRLAVAAQITVGGVIVGGLIAGVCAIGVVPLAVTGLVIGGVVAAANAPAPVYDEERRRRLRDAAGGAGPGSLAYYQRTEHVRREYGYHDSHDGCSIQFRQEQQKAYLHLSRFVSRNLQSASIESVKQGLYLPSFETRGVKINGKCTAITRGLSQASLLQSGKSFLSNLETSTEIYERIAQGKQASKREEREVFAFSKLLNNFERQLDSAANSLPSSLIHTKGYKTFSGLSNYIAGVKGDFAIHLVTSNHVVAIYRAGDNYAYFDSNAAFVSGLKSVDQLMKIVEKAVKFAGYKIEEKGFLVEHFDVGKANNLLSSEDKQILAKEIKTERQLLAEQDKELGLIKVNGQELSRVQLYDFGTKINVEGSVPLLINADMNLSSEKLQDHLNKKEVIMTAREYLDSLKNSKNIEEVVQATKVIPFIGSKREIEEAEQTRKPKRSLLEQLVKGAVNFMASNLTTAFFTNISRLESQLQVKTDNEPQTYLNDPTVDKQLQRSL